MTNPNQKKNLERLQEGEDPILPLNEEQGNSIIGGVAGSLGNNTGSKHWHCAYPGATAVWCDTPGHGAGTYFTGDEWQKGSHGYCVTS